MAYRIKRIDPFWHKNPAVPAVAAVAAVVALAAAQSGRGAVAAAAGLAFGAAVFLATKPALSGVFAVFGLLAGVVTFLAGPSAGLTPAMRALATAAFSLFYMVLMDGVVLAVAAIYNQFTRAGLRGLSLRLEE
ncbi:MAG: hypothetical protein Q8T11_15995 [Elusimicrobiota bacterium]|nr:hypothetical protein [Elusimicrobiota bacterium]